MASFGVGDFLQRCVVHNTTACCYDGKEPGLTLLTGGGTVSLVEMLIARAVGVKVSVLRQSSIRELFTQVSMVSTCSY